MQITLKSSAVHTSLKTGRKIEYIVIHYTAGVTSKAGTAINTANYFKTTSTEVSSDFIVDDTAIVQYNPDIKNRYCWHCGGAKYNNKGGSFFGKCTNANSIGVEVCSTNTTGSMQSANDKTYRFTPEVLDNAVELVKKLMTEYNIPAERVIRHYDVNGKPCPGVIGWNTDSGSNAEWEKFKARLGANKTTAGDVLYTVQTGAFRVRENAEAHLKTVQKYFPTAYIKIQ